MIVSGLKRFINCCVHQSIPLEYYQQQIIACPQFQRLQHLKQLGNSFYVYPAATHTRFSHCVGVGYLAGKLYDSILSEQPELRSIANNIDRKLVVSAGMMHDLGHGPNSHAFESWVRHAHPDLNFTHESMSLKMLQAAYDQGFLPFLNEVDPGESDQKTSDNERARKRITIIGEIIMGRDKIEKETQSTLVPEKRWILDIVSNPMIDVDRLDYLLRDTQIVFGSLPAQINYEKIFKMARVLDGRICYHTSVTENIIQVLQHRLMMFKCVYVHETSISVELMQKDILDQLDKEMNIRGMLDCAQKYARLDDSLFRLPFVQGTAKTISQRIENLDLYDFVASRWITNKKLPTKNQLFLSLEKSQLIPMLDLNDIILESRIFNYGDGDRNPVLTRKNFFDWDDVEPKKITDYCHIMPESVSQQKVYIFCKKKLSQKEKKIVENAFDALMD